MRHGDEDAFPGRYSDEIANREGNVGVKVFGVLLEDYIDSGSSRVLFTMYKAIHQVAKLKKRKKQLETGGLQ